MRRLLFYTKPYTAFFVVAVFVVLVSSIVDLTPPLLVRNAIDKYIYKSMAKVELSEND